MNFIKFIRIFLLILIIIGLGLLVTQKMWVPKIVDLIVKNDNKAQPISPVSDIKNDTKNTLPLQEGLEVFGDISNDQVGIFKISELVPDQGVLATNGYSINETTASAEGQPYTLYVVSQEGELVLNFTLSPTNKISDIRVKSSDLKTAEGIAVGSTLVDFIKAYPNYRLWYTAEEGEKFILNTTKDAATPQFFLDRSDLVNPKGVFYKTGIKASDFKADAKINDIRVFYYPY
jgi:hypothetical protein